MSSVHSGYFPNDVKTDVLVKPQHIDAAKEVFKDTTMTISDDGKRYLGGAVGTSLFTRSAVCTEEGRCMD